MKMLSKNKIAAIISIGAVLALGLIAWRGLYAGKTPLRQHDPLITLMLDWHEHTLRAERFTEGYRPPVAARVYAYSGLAAWEAALATQRFGAQSLAPNFEGLNLPAPDPNIKYHLPSVLNACYNTIFQKFFISANRSIEQERTELAEKWGNRLKLETDSNNYRVSADFGKKMALAVYEWSATDTLGHMANLHNYDRNYKPIVGTGFWQPCQDFPMPALLPQWGKTRTFVIEPAEFLAAPLPPFSMESQSQYYVQALEVYTMNSPLSSENQWVAEFWSDDFSGLTFSSAGRWISITNQILRHEQPTPIRALETYLRVSLALSDAAVACWQSKYHYNLLRPETFIRQAIQPDWRPIVHTPSFPAYPSGHAMLAAAAAEVLTGLYGKKYELTDRSHEGRTEFKSKPRSYHSFYEMAFENASSRIALGVHYRMDCDEGTRLGLAVGKKISELPLYRPKL